MGLVVGQGLLQALRAAFGQQGLGFVQAALRELQVQLHIFVGAGERELHLFDGQFDRIERVAGQGVGGGVGHSSTTRHRENG